MGQEHITVIAVMFLYQTVNENLRILPIGRTGIGMGRLLSLVWLGAHEQLLNLPSESIDDVNLPIGGSE